MERREGGRNQGQKEVRGAEESNIPSPVRICKPATPYYLNIQITDPNKRRGEGGRKEGIKKGKKKGGREKQ